MGQTDGGADRGQPSSEFTGGDPVWNVRAERFGRLSRDLQGEDDVEALLSAIVRAATATVPGAQHASISAVVKRREVHTRAATGDLPRAVDQAQYDTGQGPCLDSLYEQQTVRLANLSTEARWPDFAARAKEVGLRSIWSAPASSPPATPDAPSGTVEGRPAGADGMASAVPPKVGCGACQVSVRRL